MDEKIEKVEKEEKVELMELEDGELEDVAGGAVVKNGVCGGGC